jgi:acid phosphatase type 7
VRRGRAGRRGGFRIVFRVPAKAAGLYRVRVRVRGRSVASHRFRIRPSPRPAAPLTPAPQEPAPAPVQPPPREEEPPPPPPPPPPLDGPTLVAAGDIACSPTQAPSATSCHQGETADLVEELDPDAVAALGDNQYEHGELDNFNSMYDPSWGRFRDITFPAVGNHEYEGDPERDSAPGYFGYFGDAAGDPAEGYYSWSLGNWTVFVLNSGAIDYTRVGGGDPGLPDDCWPVSCASGSAQETWLEGELETLPDDACVLAYWHHPRFSSGYGGINRDYPETGAMYEDLYAHGAELVLSGHAHNYERFEPIDAAGNPDATAGITNFVTGTGGRSLFTRPGDQEPISETLYTNAFGVLELSLTDGAWSSRFVTDTGEVRDPAAGTCHSPPPA